ncbi:hypothetical protein [Allokutzneria albata]|uniref:hypothetical protein n=1 Tax=Allokutzneria albata TaxID=211114 RepID=UPI0012DE7CFA|nr:hypothetical protein [Allokutzneria albata]
MAVAAETSDAASPGLKRFAADHALEQILASLLDDHRKGVTSKGRPTISPTVTRAEPADAPTEVRISDCGDDSNWVKRNSTGELADPADVGGRHRIEASVVLRDGVWLVTDFRLRAAGTC